MTRRTVAPRTRRHACARACAALLLAAAAAVAPRARAQQAEVKKCVAAADRAQQLRAATKLTEAREALLECSSDACPAIVRRDCSQWIAEVQASLPSVVVGVQDAAGKDLLDVRVLIDGAVAQEKLEGKAFFINPGAHTIRYERPDGTFLEDRVLIREGEKNRPLTARFPQQAAPAGLPPPGGAAAGAGVTGAVATPAPSAPAADHASKSSPANIAIGATATALGVGALGAALVLDLVATTGANNLACAAKMTCKASDTDPFRHEYLAADVLLGAGAAATVFGVIMLAARPIKSAPSTGAAGPVQVGVGATPRGGLAQLRVTF